MSDGPNIAEFGPCNCPIRKHWSKEEIVPHWRSLVESKYLSHFELQGRDVTVRIKSVRLSEVTGSGGKKSKKALLTFYDKEKGAPMGVTCLAMIGSIYGDDIDNWPGKWITLYPTTTESSGKVVGCVRVRPTAPKGKSASAPLPPPPEREPGDDEDRGDEPSAAEMAGGDR